MPSPTPQSATGGTTAKQVRYLFVTGGVVSSIGKGITSASLGRLLRNRGFKVAMLKLDPYINVDAGTMNPYQHGECFVTDDGAETDLDLGHYERFVDIELTSGNLFKVFIQGDHHFHQKDWLIHLLL